MLATAVRASGLPDLADVIARQGIVDQASAALPADLAGDYCAQVTSAPMPSLPGAVQLRENAIVALERAERLLAVLSCQPPGLGEVDADTFADAVSDAAWVLTAVWRMALADLLAETKAVMADATGGMVKLGTFAHLR